MSVTKGSPRQSVQPLPGTSTAHPVGMSCYIVLLKEDDLSTGENKGRREIYETNAARTAAFRERLRRWLDERGLTGQVAVIGEPMGFPLLTLTATPAVAKEIQTLPDVEGVLQDDEGLKLTR